MAPKKLARIGGFALAVAVACFGGCQHSASAPRGSLAPGEPMARTELNARQQADLHIAYGRTLEKRGEAGQALVRYHEAVKQDPDRGDAWLRLAVLHDQEGKFVESAEMYRKALAARPGDPEIFCDVGYSFYLQGRWAEAEMNLRQAIALRPDHARAHNNLGLLLARTGRDAEALPEFRKAGCSEAEAHANVGFALALQRQLPQAREHYRKALAADAGFRVARAGLARVEAVIARASPRESEASDCSDKAVTPVSHWQAAKPQAPHH